MKRKLTAAQVLTIRQHERGVKQQAIAARYGISQSAVSRIFNGQRWCWCSTPPPKFTAPAATKERTS